MFLIEIFVYIITIIGIPYVLFMSILKRAKKKNKSLTLNEKLILCIIIYHWMWVIILLVLLILREIPAIANFPMGSFIWFLIFCVVMYFRAFYIVIVINIFSVFWVLYSAIAKKVRLKIIIVWAISILMFIFFEYKLIDPYFQALMSI